MEMAWLKTFIVAAKHENYRMAAEELFISQPAITKHIQNLERVMGAELFSRNNKRVSLNANGAQFLPIAQNIVASYDDGMHRFGNYLKGYVREVKLGVAPQIANSILPFVWKEFAAVHPNVQLTIEIMKSNEIANAIFEGKIQIGLSKIAPTQSLLVREVIEEPIVLILPKSQQHQSTAFLMENEKILTHEYAPYWEELQFRIQKHYPGASFMKVNQTETIKHFVQQGLGIAFLPKSVVSVGLTSNELVIRNDALITGCSSKTYFISKYETEDSVFLSSLFQKVFKQRSQDV